MVVHVCFCLWRVFARVYKGLLLTGIYVVRGVFRGLFDDGLNSQMMV